MVEKGILDENFEVATVFDFRLQQQIVQVHIEIDYKIVCFFYLNDFSSSGTSVYHGSSSGMRHQCLGVDAINNWLKNKNDFNIQNFD